MTVRDYLKEHGINKESVKKFGLISDEKNETLIIPIKNGTGKIIYYKNRHLDETKNKFSFSPYGSKCTLFNVEILKGNDSVFITEGEVDCIRLIQQGITAAISGTAGCKTFKAEWAELLKDKRVFICYDTDTEGKEGSQKVLEKLPNAKIINLPEHVKDICEYFNKYTLDDFKKLWEEEISGTETPPPTPTIDELVDVVEAYIPNTGRALKIALAVATSGTRVNRTMLWMIFVGAPSGGKTDITKLLKKSSCIVKADSLTPNAFVSGERETQKQKNQDMLPALVNKCLLIKDLTVLFSQNEEAAKKIIGDLVGIYDKEFTKQAPGRGNISYESEFSILACITPATLNRHHNYLNMIGARFLQYTIPPLTKNDEEKSFNAIFDEKTDRAQQEKTAQSSVSNYLDFLNLQDITKIKSPNQAQQEYLKIASLFMCKARGIVIIQSGSYTNKEGKSVTYYEPLDIQIEYPWRAVQQLIEISKYLALASQKDEIGEEELEIIKDIVLSSMPADRAQAIRALEETPEITAKDLSEQVARSWKTASRLLEELSWLKVVEKEKGVGQIAANYKLSQEFKGFVTLSPSDYMSTPEFMSTNYRRTESSGRSHEDPKTVEEVLDELPF